MGTRAPELQGGNFATSYLTLGHFLRGRVE